MIENKKLKTAMFTKDNNKMWGQILSSQGSLISIVSLLCSLVYFIHFNFAAGILRLVYLIFLCLNPLISFIANMVIANNFKNNVL